MTGAFIMIFAGLALVVLRVGYGLVDSLMAVDRLVTVLQDRPRSARLHTVRQPELTRREGDRQPTSWR